MAGTSCGSGLYTHFAEIDSGTPPTSPPDGAPDTFPGSPETAPDTLAGTDAADALVGTDAAAITSVTKTIGTEGGEIALAEATLFIGIGTMSQAVPVTLRRYDYYGRAGAISPVFEVQVPAAGTFVNNNPAIAISTSADVLANPSSAIAFVTAPTDYWVPTIVPTNCPALSICGTVYNLRYVAASGTTPEVTSLYFSIVVKCDSTTVCPPRQACNSGACQACANGPLC